MDALPSAEIPDDALTPVIEDDEPLTTDQQIEDETSDVENGSALTDSSLEDMAEIKETTPDQIEQEQDAGEYCPHHRDM